MPLAPEVARVAERLLFEQREAPCLNCSNQLERTGYTTPM